MGMVMLFFREMLLKQSDGAKAEPTATETKLGIHPKLLTEGESLLNLK